MRRMVIVGLLAAGLGACGQTERDNRIATGAVIGGATGAVIGGLATGRASGAVAGGAIGAAGGAIIGGTTAPRQRCWRDVYGRRYCERY